MTHRLDFASAADIPAGEWRWPHINPATEWACKGTGQIVIVSTFLDRVEELRTRCGFALPISSGYRSPEHNREVSTTGTDGPHTTGQACDIAVRGPQALTVLAVALAMGFTGIGINQKGDGRFVHVDDAHETPTIWSYLLAMAMCGGSLLVKILHHNVV